MVVPQAPVLSGEWLVAELPRLYRERPDLVQPLLHNLLSENETLRWSLIVRAYVVLFSPE